MSEQISEFLAYVAFTAIGSFLSLHFFGLYRDTEQSPPSRSWTQPWVFSVEDLHGFSYGRLILVSLLGLFLELLMIRWISSEIRIFAYFKNFVLIACFLGFGLGCYLCRRKINLLAIVAPPVFLALLITLPWQGLRDLVASLPVYLGAASEVQIWGVPSIPLTGPTLALFIAGVVFTVPIFALIALTFIPIGQLVGWYLENSPRGIRGYTVNVLASLAGILLYTVISFLNQPPAVWFALAGGMLLLLCWQIPRLRWTIAVMYVICIAMVQVAPSRKSVTYWSPYQKLTLAPQDVAGQVIAYHLTTNNSWYQKIINLSDEFVATHPDLFDEVPIEWNAYNLPYHFYPEPPSVLVLGSGMGNDVAAALRNGAEQVLAVEIDPLILKLGRELHFERPYSSPRVRQVVDDARSYIQNSQERFDLILFSLLDSHTTSSHYSNIRIDNYVYTIEALEAAKALLQPDGVFIVKFWVGAPWIAGRLQGLLETVFGHPPLLLQSQEGYTSIGMFFVTGSEQRIQGALEGPDFAAFLSASPSFDIAPATLTTDDWPYFYQHEPGLPASVIVISVVLVLLCASLLNQVGSSVLAIRWHFFFLGAGFLLLEVQIVSKMALLFGTTWVINSIVIAGLLSLIVAANILVEKWPNIPIRLAYMGILVAVGVSYAIPLERYFFESIWMKAVAATLVLCLPVFFAGIVFIQSFARSGFQGEALGSNLLGALVGGVLESLSFWTGIQSLLIVAALLYLASFLALGEKQPLRMLARTRLSEL